MVFALVFSASGEYWPDEWGLQYSCAYESNLTIAHYEMNAGSRRDRNECATSSYQTWALREL